MKNVEIVDGALNRRFEIYAVDDGVFAQLFTGLDEDYVEDLSEDMRRIALPTLIVWGAEDHITPPDEAERLHSLVSTSKLVTFPNAGHFVHQEFPREVAAAIKQFV